MEKTFETAREIIDCLVDFHHRAAQLAETGMDQEQEERVSQVFNDLYDHHLGMLDVLATYDDEGDDSVFNYPVTYALAASEAPEAFIDELPCGENMAFEDVANLSQDLADYALGLFDDICGEISEPRLLEAFSHLQEMEQEELKMLSRAVNSLRGFEV